MKTIPKCFPPVLQLLIARCHVSGNQTEHRCKYLTNARRSILPAVLLTLITLQDIQAQTKVFREVREGISTKLRTIMQDGTLVGYLSFTELERVDKDSFSYRITVMDENLNELGIVTFKELKLDLHQVSLEKDTLCLAYIRSNVIGCRR